MPIDADTALAPEILILRMRGEWPTLSDSQTLRRRLIANGHLTPATRALIDVRDVMTPPYTEAQSIISAAVTDGGLPLVRAYLIGSAVQFGFARQLQGLAPSNTRIEVFSNEQAAFMWLRRSTGKAEDA